MLSPWRVYDIVQHLQRHLSIPVTVKCRIGVDSMFFLSFFLFSSLMISNLIKNNNN